MDTKEKDPAFLFYSKDFYEGTRTMLPEERACYIDLMIYQHQNKYIPDDLRRVLLYCNGISEATLIATLQAKFKHTPNGWVNEKLAKVILEREEYSEKQSINGVIGQFWKKSKAILSNKDYLKLRNILDNKTKEELYQLVCTIEVNEATLKAMLKASLKHLEDGNGIENGIGDGDKDINKDKVEIKNSKRFIPSSLENDVYSFDEFWNDYDKKVGEKGKIEKKFKALTDKDKLNIREHIPKYKRSQPDKQFRKNPETYLNNKAWNDEIIIPQEKYQEKGKTLTTFEEKSFKQLN